MSKLINFFKMQIKAHHVIITLFIIIPIYSILVLTFTRYKQIQAELVYDVDRTVVLDNTGDYFVDFDMDAGGNVYVWNDDYYSIDKYDSDGFNVGYSDELVYGIHGLAVTDSGDVYVTVASDEYESIWHYDSNLNYIDKFDIAPLIDNIGLRGLTIYNGFAYVAAEYENTIYSVDLSDGTVSVQTNSALISNPVDVEIDTSGAEDRLYVLNMEGSYGNPQIFYCDLNDCAASEGSFAEEIEYPWKLAVDSDGYVYVLDLYLPGVQIYDDAHNYVENLQISETANDVAFFNDRVYMMMTGSENRAAAFYTYLNAPAVSITPTPLALEVIDYDDFPGYTLPNLDLTISGNNSTASIQPDINEPLYIDGIDIDYTGWFNYFNDMDDVNVTITTCVSEFDSALAVYSGDPGEPYDLAGLYTEAEGAAYECPNTYYGAQFEVTLYSGVEYYFQFGGQYGATGNFEIQFSTTGLTPTLSATPTPSQDNNDFENAITIGLNESSYSEGILETSTIQANEPTSFVYDKFTAQNSVWWQFTAPYDTDISIGTCDEEYGNMDTMIAVYTGTQLSDLSKVIDNQLGCNNDGAMVFLSVTEGTTYYIQVSLRNPSEFNEVSPVWFNLDLYEEIPSEEPPLNDNFVDATEVELDQLDEYGDYLPYFIDTSRNASMEVGEPDAGTYTLDPRTVWWKWTNDSTVREVWVDTCNHRGPGRVDTLLSIYTGDSVDDLTLIAENDELGDDTSDAQWSCIWQDLTSFLTFQAQPNTTYYIRMLDISNRNISMSMTIRNRPTVYATRVDTPPGDYWCSNHGGVAKTLPYGMSDGGGSWLAWEECWAWCQANMTDEYPICQDNGDSTRACWLNKTPEGGMDNCEWVLPEPGWQHPMGSYVGEVGGYLLSLDPDLRATLVSNLDMDVTVFRQVGERGIYVLDSDDSMIMANVGVLFNANHDWTDLSGEVDMVGGKVFIGDPSSEPGAVGAYNLMAPILESDPSDYLLLCPLAESILDVSETCPGATIVSEADPTVSVVTGTDGNDYWMVEGLTQSMGAMNYTLPYTPECGNDIIDEGEQCDGFNLGGFTCSSFPGYNSGDLGCNESCSYDVGQCTYIAPTVTPTVTPIPTITTSPTVTGTVTSSPVPTPTPTPETNCIYVTEQGECIEELEIINVRTSTDDGEIEICWDSNAPSTGVIKYGQRGLMDKITLPETEEKLLDHCIVISDAEYDIPYDYEINIEYQEYLDNYLGNFEIKHIDYDSQCHVYLNRDYAYDDQGNVSFTFTTDNTSYCTLSFGNEPQKMDAFGTVTPYSSSFKAEMDIGLDNRLNVYYQVSCVSVVNQCSASDVISAKTLAPMLEEVGLFSTQNRALISTSSIALALIGLGLAFIPILFTSPNLLMYGVIWFLPRKKNKPWGIVYDANDRKPIPFAVIRIYGFDGRVLKQAVTDLEGKFSFILDQGTYNLEVVHSEYSKFTQEVVISNKEEQLALDIPLKKNGQPTALNIKKIAQNMLTSAGWIIGIGGLILSIIALLFNLSAFNLVVLALYVVQLGMLVFVKPPRNWGYLYDQQSGERIKGGFLRVFDKDQNRQVEIQMSDEKGRFGFRLPKGSYHLGVAVPGYEFADTSSLLTLGDGTKVLDIGDGKVSDVSIALTRKVEQALPIMAENTLNQL
jgi:hypothetical protein